MKKEDWINRIIESHRDLKYNDLPENVFPKILKEIHDPNKDIEPYAWLKIAAILIVSISLTQTSVSKELNTKPEKGSIELIVRNNNMIYE